MLVSKVVYLNQCNLYRILLVWEDWGYSGNSLAWSSNIVYYKENKEKELENSIVRGSL